MKISMYKEDKEKQEQGSPCYYGDAYFNVKRANTPEYQVQIEEIKNNLYGFAPKEVDNNKIVAYWLAEYGVTGWDGVLDEEDKELIFSRENARGVFLNPAFHLSLNLLLLQHAGNYNNYLFDAVNADIEQIKKN